MQNIGVCQKTCHYDRLGCRIQVCARRCVTMTGVGVQNTGVCQKMCHYDRGWGAEYRCVSEDVSL